MRTISMTTASLCLLLATVSLSVCSATVPSPDKLWSFSFDGFEQPRAILHPEPLPDGAEEAVFVTIDQSFTGQAQESTQSSVVKIGYNHGGEIERLEFGGSLERRCRSGGMAINSATLIVSPSASFSQCGVRMADPWNLTSTGVVWNYPLFSNVHPLNHRPVLSPDGKFVYLSDNIVTGIICLLVNGGGLVWRREINTQHFSLTMDGLFLFVANYDSFSPGEVYKLNAINGSTVSTSLEVPIPASAGGVALNSDESKLYTTRPNELSIYDPMNLGIGAILSKEGVAVDSQFPPILSPVNQELLYAVTFSPTTLAQFVAAFNATTLETVWSYKFDSGVLLPPVVMPDESAIFVATDYIGEASNVAKLWRLNGQSGTVDWIYESQIPGSLIWDISLSYDATRIYMTQSAGDLSSEPGLELIHSFLTRKTTFEPSQMPSQTPMPSITPGPTASPSTSYPSMPGDTENPSTAVTDRPTKSSACLSILQSVSALLLTIAAALSLL